jgi:hypothetical protein
MLRDIPRRFIMQDKTNPADGEAPKQVLSDVPGAKVIIPEGVYKIYTHLTNINVVNMEPEPGSGSATPHRVNLYHDNNEPQSKWRIRYESRVDAHLIINQYYPVLEIEAIDYSDVYATQRSATLKSSYYWLFKSSGTTDVYFIESISTGHVLDVEGSGMADRTRILQWPYKASANQKFKLVKV